ncbi:MAG TPA: VCBS repeat-containing protein [Gemmataceae bacterium]|nr:VCBS repeat-containing protein [Gemmataceae bacterium]
MKPLLTLSLFRFLGGKSQRKPVRPTFRPLLNTLEDRLTPAGGLVDPPPADGIGGDDVITPGINPQAVANRHLLMSLSAYSENTGGAPVVHVIDNSTGQERFALQAFDPSFQGGVRIAIADMDEDRIPDIIVGAGPGGGPHVRIFSGSTGQLIDSPIANMMAFDTAFTGGVYVAGGDVNGDGRGDLIVGAGEGGGPHVRVFNGQDGSLLFNDFVYESSFRGGVRVAAGDVNADGFADIITGPGVGGGPFVKVFSGADNSLFRSFLAFKQDFRGGIYVASGDVDGDSFTDIVVSQGAGDVPWVKTFHGPNLMIVNSFHAYATSFTGGSTVAVNDLDQDGMAEIITGAGPGGGPNLRVYRGTETEPTLLADTMPLDPAFTGGIFVA